MWQKPLNKLLIDLVDIGADLAADDLVVCIRICRSGYCDVATRLLHMFYSYPNRTNGVTADGASRIVHVHRHSSC